MANINIINHVSWAVHTFFFFEIEILRNVASNTTDIIPEGALFTLTDRESRIVDLAACASITGLSSDIPERSFRTSNAFIAVENWAINWTIDTHFLKDVIDLIIRAGSALETVKIKIFRMITLDACLTVEKGIDLLAGTTGNLGVKYSSS